MNGRLALRLVWVPAIALLAVAPAGCWTKSTPNAPAPAASTTPSASVTPTGASVAATSELVPGTVPTPTTGPPGYLKTTPPKPPAPGTARPTDASIIAAAGRLAKRDGEVDAVTSTKVLGVTQDRKKKWWAYVVLNEGQGDSQVQLILFNDGKTWDIRASGITLSYEDMPLDVRF